ncbi:MAG: ribosome recycling factor [Candidatus Buchananbacteria bacterium]|jgi:ribosome recycling factor
MSIIDNHKEEFIKAINHFQSEIGGLKTGRANPLILDSVRVEAYGALNPIINVASVTVPDARSLIVTPWDKSIIKEIEKGIVDANLNLNPVNEGDKLRINLPPLTEETRKEIVKLLHQRAEDGKISLRMVRDKVKDEIMEAEKNKEFGEDEKFRLLEELDKKVGSYNDQIKELTESKEAEIMTV